MSILQYRSSELMATRKAASDLKNDTECLTFAATESAHKIKSDACIAYSDSLERKLLENELKEVWE